MRSIFPEELISHRWYSSVAYMPCPWPRTKPNQWLHSFTPWNVGAPCQCQYPTFCPSNVHVQNLSNICQTYDLLMSHLCPCPHFDYVLSPESKFWPVRVQHLSAPTFSCPTNVLFWSFLLSRNWKILLDNFWTYFEHGNFLKICLVTL